MNAQTRAVDVERVTQQSKERLSSRVAAVESLAVAHNERVDGEAEATRRRENLEAELARLTDSLVREHKTKHQAALKAGWTERDLRALGLDLPTKYTSSKRSRRKTTSARHEASPLRIDNGPDTGPSVAQSA